MGWLLSMDAGAQSILSSERPHGRTGHPLGHPPVLRGGGTPANDECATAEVLTVHTQEECTTMATSGNNGGSTTTNGDPSCDASTDGYQDVWYSFNTGTNELVSISLTPDPAMTDWAFTVLDGCAGSESACVIQPGGPYTVTLTANTDYIIRVYSNLQYGVGGPFTICVAGLGEIADPPVNDECTGAEVHDLTVGGSFTAMGTTLGATDSEGVGSPTVWEAFTLTECADVTVSFCANAPELTTVYTSVVLGCPFTTAFDAQSSGPCTDGGTNYTMTFFGLQPETYYLPVRSELGAQGPYTVTISAVGCPAPPSNDDCAGAILLPSGDQCTEVTGTVAGATQSIDPLECNGYTSNNAIDVWYKFVASSADETIGVHGNGTFDAVVELLQGDCNGLTSIGCADATVTDPAGAVEEIVQSGLTVGDTYYVRVYSYGNQMSIREFEICVKEGAGSGIGIAEHRTPVAFSVYPNPTDGDLTLSYGDATGPVTIDVLDMAGRMVFAQQRTLTQGQNVVLALGGKLSSGVYTLRLSTAHGRSEQRVVVK